MEARLTDSKLRETSVIIQKTIKNQQIYFSNMDRAMPRSVVKHSYLQVQDDNLVEAVDIQIDPMD